MSIVVTVQIAGISNIFVSEGRKGAYTAPAGYTALSCLDWKGLEGLREEMPQFGGVGKPSGFTLTLVNRGNAIAPLFSRTPESVTSAGLEDTLEASASPVVVQAVGPINAFPNSGYLFIGQETLRYDSKDNGAKTFNVVERGCFNSPISAHVADSNPARSWQPLIAAYPVVWDMRGVIVTLYDTDIKGTVIASSAVELLRGIITVPPQERAANEWEITVAQELARFDQELGDARYATTLAEGWHYFDGRTASRVKLIEILPPWCVLYSTPAVSINADVAADTDIEVWDTRQYIEVFDTNRGTYVASTANGRLSCPARELYDLEVASVDLGPPGEYHLVSPITLSANLDQITNEFITHDLVIEIAENEGLQKWPEAAVSRFNDYANVTRTVNGAFYYLDCALSADASVFTCVADWKFNESVPPVFGMARMALSSPDYLWFPWLNWTSDELTARGAGITGMHGDGVDWLTIAAKNFSDDVDARAYPIPAKLGFYQARERYLFVQDNMFTSASEASPSVVRCATPEGAEIALEIDQSTEIENDSGEVVGYALRLTERSRVANNVSFGNTAEGKVTIAPFIQFQSEDPRTMLLKIMLSGYTTTPGYPNATYSVLPPSYGLRIPEDSVDITGILAFPVPQGLRSINFKPIKPMKATELLNDILKILGASLVMANIGGRRKVTLVRSRYSAALLASDSISNADWLPQERPLANRFSEVSNIFRIFGNYDPATDKFLAEATFEDQTSIDLYGQRSSLEVKVKGLQVINRGIPVAGIQAQSAFIGVYKTLRAMAAYAPITFVGSVLWSAGVNLTVGKTVLVSIDDALDGNGEAGNIQAVPMLVTALSFYPTAGKVTVELIFRGRKTTSFAPFAKIESVSGDTVTLSSNECCNLNHPITSAVLKDWYFFASNGALPPGGCPIECVSVGSEEDNDTSLVISSLDMLTGEAVIVGHSLGVGDRIRPLDWDSAVSFHKIYAYLSDNGLLGTYEDSGFVYS